MKLTIELVPGQQWGANLRALLTKKQWDILRHWCYERAKNRCEICGGVGRKHPVEAHEIWRFDETTRTQHLDGLIALCPSCHSTKHFGRSQAVGKEQEVRAHMRKVNDMTDTQVSQAIAAAWVDYDRRSQFEWKLDLSWLGRFNQS